MFQKTEIKMLPRGFEETFFDIFCANSEVLFALQTFDFDPFVIYFQRYRGG